jgi:hypothetical protein
VLFRSDLDQRNAAPSSRKVRGSQIPRPIV